MHARQLIEAIARRDQDAMLALYGQYSDLVFSVACRILGENTAAEECLQDTFMKVWQNIGQYDPARGPIHAWLIGIARNLAVDRLRSMGRRIQPQHSLDDERRTRAIDLLDDPAERERANALRMAIQKLPPEQAQIIDLSYFGGMAQSDIAEYLNIPLGTVKTRMRLAMQKLKEAWLAE